MSRATIHSISCDSFMLEIEVSYNCSDHVSFGVGDGGYARKTKELKTKGWRRFFIGDRAYDICGQCAKIMDAASRAAAQKGGE